MSEREPYQVEIIRASTPGLYKLHGGWVRHDAEGKALLDAIARDMNTAYSQGLKAGRAEAEGLVAAAREAQETLYWYRQCGCTPNPQVPGTFMASPARATKSIEALAAALKAWDEAKK